ncbi:hybrid sensor histidine kinase/response regulator transcription factor [Labilibaculum filiforme]|nr:hybrid sensor histidine kinase/response regulator transcription factor [Labilibaculum filiforme]
MACLLSLNNFAQNIRFDHLDINDGLSQNSAFCMDIDANGYVWVGTLNGLNRYDGYSFEVFKPSINRSGSLKGSLCSDLVCDSEGNTWIATVDGGLNKYDYLHQRFIQYHDSLFPSFSTKSIQKLSIDKRGWLWLKSPNTIIGFNPKDSTIISPLPEQKISNISLLFNGNIAACGDFGLYEIESNTNTLFTINYRIKEPVVALAYSNSKTVVLHQDKIDFYDNKLLQRTQSFLLKNIENSLPIGENSQILVDSNKIWIGRFQALVKYELIENQLICKDYQYDANNSNSFRGYQITKILKDKAENIWIGTAKHGINIISKRVNEFKHFNWIKSPSSEKEIDLVRAICASSKNEYWLGFDRTGLGIIYPNGKQKLITTYLDSNNKELALKSVRTIFEDQQKNIWVAMLDGFCIYNRKSQQLEHINRYLKSKWNNRSYSIKQFSDTEVVITTGTKIGIIDLESKTEEIFPNNEENRTIQGSIRDIEVDGNSIWIGLDQHGIAQINTQTKEITHFNTNSIGLSDNKVYNLSKIGNDLWIATNNGLNRFNTSTKKVDEIFYEEHGLANNIVYSLNPDEDNNLWMSTNRGISKLNLTTKQFCTYLKSDAFMDDASFQATDGSIFYGGYNGVIHFKPKQLQISKTKPNPFIENFSLHNKIILPNSIIDDRVLLKQHINQSDRIQLNYSENTFSFNFKTIPFEIPNSNKYRYKLENWQNEWQDGDNKSAIYTNVLPGEYLFKLSVSNSEENWSPAKEIQIIITPPYWKKLWFKLMLTGIFLVFLFTTYRLRVYQIQERNKLLKQKVDEQTKDIVKQNKEIQKISEQLHEADEAKLRFFTNISHEFRTPLTLILGYLEELDEGKSFHIKKTIKNNALRLLRLVNQLIEFRKLDQDQLKLEVSSFELNRFVGDIVESFKKLASNKNIALAYEPYKNRIPVWLDVDKTEKILFNLISNAVKYTSANNSISVSTHDNLELFEIKVIDSGIGISEEEITQIFNRFFRSKNSNESGHGIGLALAKGLTEMQYGNLSASSVKGKGSTFTVQFRKGKDHFKNNEFASEKQVKAYLPEKQEEIISVGKQLNNVFEKRILLVEDDEELRNFLQKILSDQFSITSAENGLDAIQKLENIIPDLIVSDISMPKMDGITFCKKVKENPLTAKIPFILLTAKTDSITHIEGFKLGIDDYIEKPFNKQVLIARIEALINNREKLFQAPIERRTMAKLDKSKFSKNDVQFWKKTNTIINRNYSNPNFTTEVLSENSNMSRSTFYRKFKGLCGENAADYIRKIRLHKAAELVQKKELNIQQISLEVGFQSTAHFRTKFKEYFGVNPSEYS